MARDREVRTYKKDPQSKKAFYDNGGKRHIWTLEQRCVVFYTLSPQKFDRSPSECEDIFQLIFDDNARSNIYFTAYQLRDDFNNRNAAGRSKMYVNRIMKAKGHFTNEEIAAHQWAVQAIQSACLSKGYNWGTLTLDLGAPTNGGSGNTNVARTYHTSASNTSANSAAGGITKKRPAAKPVQAKTQKKPRGEIDTASSSDCYSSSSESEQDESLVGDRFSDDSDEDAFEVQDDHASDNGKHAALRGLTDGDDEVAPSPVHARKPAKVPAAPARPLWYTKERDPETGVLWPIGWGVTPNDYVDASTQCENEQDALLAQINALPRRHTRRSLASSAPPAIQASNNTGSEKDGSEHQFSEDESESSGLPDDDESTPGEHDEAGEDQDAGNNGDVQHGSDQSSDAGDAGAGQQEVEDEAEEEEDEQEQDKDNTTHPTDVDGEADALQDDQANDQVDDNPPTQRERSPPNQSQPEHSPAQPTHNVNDATATAANQLPDQGVVRRQSGAYPLPGSQAPAVHLGSPADLDAQRGLAAGPPMPNPAAQQVPGWMTWERFQVHRAITNIHYDDRVRLLQAAFPTVPGLYIDSTLTRFNGDFTEAWKFLMLGQQPLFPFEEALVSKDNPLSENYIPRLRMFHSRGLIRTQSGLLPSAFHNFEIQRNSDLYKNGGILVTGRDPTTEAVSEFMACNPAWCLQCNPAASFEQARYLNDMPFVHATALDWTHAFDENTAIPFLVHLGRPDVDPSYMPPRTTCLLYDVNCMDGYTRQMWVCAEDCQLCMVRDQEGNFPRV
ncbi:hypothetical protein Q7P37_002334 [Cladosporium fusiforme]